MDATDEEYTPEQHRTLAQSYLSRAKGVLLKHDRYAEVAALAALATAHETMANRPRYFTAELKGRVPSVNDMVKEAGQKVTSDQPCQYCGRDSQGANYDGGDSYSCGPCADWRAKVNTVKRDLKRTEESLDRAERELRDTRVALGQAENELLKRRLFP